MLGQWDERARGGAWQLRRLLVCNGGLAATIRKGGPDRTLRSARQLYDDKGVAASRRPRHTPKLSTEKEMPRFPARNRIPVPFEDCEARRIRSPNLRRRHLGSTCPQTLTASNSSVRVAPRARKTGQDGLNNLVACLSQTYGRRVLLAEDWLVAAPLDRSVRIGRAAYRNRSALSKTPN